MKEYDEKVYLGFKLMLRELRNIYVSVNSQLEDCCLSGEMVTVLPPFENVPPSVCGGKSLRDHHTRGLGTENKSPKVLRIHRIGPWSLVGQLLNHRAIEENCRVSEFTGKHATGAL